MNTLMVWVKPYSNHDHNHSPTESITSLFVMCYNVLYMSIICIMHYRDRLYKKCYQKDNYCYFHQGMHMHLHSAFLSSVNVN